MTTYRLVRLFNVCYERYRYAIVHADFDVMCELESDNEDYLREKLTFDFLSHFFDYPSEHYVIIKCVDNEPTECTTLVDVRDMKVYFDSAEHDIRLVASVAMGKDFDIIHD